MFHLVFNVHITSLSNKRGSLHFIDGGYFSYQSLYFQHLYYNVIIEAVFSGCDSDRFFKRLIKISRVIKSAL